MPSFQQIALSLFALSATVLATEPTYDSTLYVTSTIYRVNTVTASGTPGAVPAANSTTTIVPTIATAAAVPIVSASSYYAIPSGTNSTTKPTGTGVPAVTEFPGAASAVSGNAAFAAAIAAGMAILAL
ncbi:hypothetical protein P280DRAFT_300294 [Massarina eburnea CBS 473.64]|uniref:GPI anchored protein n=1 Tax=Massarina eburnea CBS 473.64 TaxID=1395130 RepID=A0A6A6S1N6_9PLEO|nr:hypothetical protein P280DRAFT_300294 [Massarina eburnea CBS 473.64]